VKKDDIRQKSPEMARREFLRNCVQKLPSYLALMSVLPTGKLLADNGDDYDPTGHDYAMGIDIHKCIGCGRCADACKKENKVPKEPHFFRTWVERYVIPSDGETRVDSPNGGIDGFPKLPENMDVLRSFFVPKLCNHCKHAPCVQVCPVGATFSSRDGVVLVDESYCVGCRYCIQACPYGARYLHPEKHVADKCTFCYHRITKGMLPACVEVCPTQARVFGELGPKSSPLRRFMRFNEITKLKPWLNTEPKVFYAGADGEVI
jgi:Fe-S-cluster-containing dehydrogenase component